MIIGIIIVLVVLGLGYVVLYNGLQKAKVNTEESWSQIDVQLKRRNDLIPNLIETVKGYAKYEQATFEKVVALRNQLIALPNDAMQEKMDLSNQITDSLKSIFALNENYPDLKANQQYKALMEELTNTENKIAYSRQLFNSSAAFYNQKLVTFPSNLIAKMAGMQKVAYLETPEVEKEAPKVSF